MIIVISNKIYQSTGTICAAVSLSMLPDEHMRS